MAYVMAALLCHREGRGSSMIRKRAVRGETYVLTSFMEYWFPMLFCEMTEPMGAWKMEAGVNLDCIVSG